MFMSKQAEMSKYSIHVEVVQVQYTKAEWIFLLL